MFNIFKRIQLPPHGYMKNGQPHGSVVEFIKEVLEEMNIRDYVIEMKPLYEMEGVLVAHTQGKVLFLELWRSYKNMASILHLATKAQKYLPKTLQWLSKKF